MVLIKRKSKINMEKRNIITYSNPDSDISEQFRNIQINIHFLTDDFKNRVILVTSPNTGEGKTTIVANLAVSISQQKEKVLLIDANFRNPEIHTFFKIENTVGLTNVLSGKTLLKEAVHRINIGKLEVLTSGTIPFDSAELLGSQMMQELIKNTLQNYDVVLIDSPSILDVADAKLLANQCNGVVLVINSGKTQRKKAMETKKILDFAKAQLIGVILNERN